MLEKDAPQQVGEALGTDSDYYQDLSEDIERFEQVVNASGEEVTRLAGQTGPRLCRAHLH